MAITSGIILSKNKGNASMAVALHLQYLVLHIYIPITMSQANGDDFSKRVQFFWHNIVPSLFPLFSKYSMSFYQWKVSPMLIRSLNRQNTRKTCTLLNKSRTSTIPRCRVIWVPIVSSSLCFFELCLSHNTKEIP